MLEYKRFDLNYWIRIVKVLQPYGGGLQADFILALDSVLTLQSHIVDL